MIDGPEIIKDASDDSHLLIRDKSIRQYLLGRFTLEYNESIPFDTFNRFRNITANLSNLIVIYIVQLFPSPLSAFVFDDETLHQLINIFLFHVCVRLTLSYFIKGSQKFQIINC